MARLALVAVSIVALTGCVPRADAALSSPPSAEATQGATPTPTTVASPGPAQQDADDPSTWIVSGAGIGPVTIGSDVGEFSVVGPYTEQDEDCPNPAVHSLAGDGVAPMTVVAVDGGSPVASVHVTSWGAQGTPVASPRTAEGIGLDSSLADVQSAYPGIELSDTHGETLQYASPDQGGWVIFTVQDDVVVQVSASTTSHNPSEHCG
jgi:hypothetical protein